MLKRQAMDLVSYGMDLDQAVSTESREPENPENCNLWCLGFSDEWAWHFYVVGFLRSDHSSNQLCHLTEFVIEVDLHTFSIPSI